MFRLVKASEFSKEVSVSPRLKFSLTWLTFGGLILPAALLMSVGYAANYVLPLMLVAILPFQYVAFCVLRGLDHGHRTKPVKRSYGGYSSLSRHLRIFATEYQYGPTPLAGTMIGYAWPPADILAVQIKLSQAEEQIARALLQLSGEVSKTAQLRDRRLRSVTPVDVDKLKVTIADYLLHTVMPTLRSGPTFASSSPRSISRDFDAILVPESTLDRVIRLQRAPLELRMQTTHSPLGLPDKLTLTETT